MADEDLSSERPTYGVEVHETPNFELPSYIANYKGRTVFRRLHLIASCSIPLQEEAARMAVAEAKKGSDVRNYHEAVALLKKASRGKNVDNLVDPVWAAQQEKRNAAETARLENELKGYKNNLIKESIRMGNEDLGNHYYTIGDLNNAVKAYSRMRDYCTTAAHIASTAFRIVAVAIEQKNWLAVQSQVHKIRNLQMKPEDMARNQPKIYAAMGLQQMSIGDYHDAAISFLNTEASLGDSYSEVITSNDVAVYGGLCALASMTRSELQTEVLDNANFRNFLELEPHIRRAIKSFCAGKYNQCLDILESYRPDYLLDIYLQPLLADIYKKIRTKSMIQYFEPFSKVTLANMEKMFGSPINPQAFQGADNDAGTTAAAGPETFLDEIIALIEDGKLDARIDLEHGTLDAVQHDLRAEAQQAALDMVERFEREAHQKLLRLQVINAGIEVKLPPSKKKPTWDGDSVDGGGGASFDDGARDIIANNSQGSSRRGAG
ncbi:COP9 signalosome complex subunit 1 [Exophiala dermatitidis]